MPVIQKIRNHGVWLIGVIGLALFAFIAEEFFRSLELPQNAEFYNGTWCMDTVNGYLPENGVCR